MAVGSREVDGSMPIADGDAVPRVPAIARLAPMRTEPEVTVRRLRPEDAEASASLRREMLTDAPFAFLASPGDDVGCDVVGVRRILSEGDGNVIFGAFAPSLVGSLGAFRERHEKAAHKVTVWGMYVTPGHRRFGVGRRLLEAAIAHARSLPGVRQVHLGVSERAPAARGLYESLGFRRWGTEPRGVSYGGEFADEHHMVLSLDSGGS
jgi:GNAT superfamily N-acetyltransferase